MYQYPPRKIEWSPDYKLLTFTYPIESNHVNRKFQITIFYSDGKT
jgi:hypothetical protein